MAESIGDESLPAPKQQLIYLLQSDFTPKKASRASPSEKDNALKSFLHHTRSVEDIEARLQSEDNLQLGRSLAELLVPAAVTDSFKAFIVDEVRKAHAWESKVSDAVAPDRLGIVSGDGIFSPSQAQELEAQALRGFGFDIARKYTLAPSNEDAEDVPPLMLKPGFRPSDYVEAVDRLNDWNGDYLATYEEDPFEDLEGDVYLDASSKVVVMSEKEADLTGLTNLAEVAARLKWLRDQREPD